MARVEKEPLQLPGTDGRSALLLNRALFWIILASVCRAASCRPNLNPPLLLS